MSEPYYSKTPQEALAEQQAAAAGLSDQEVERRRNSMAAISSPKARRKQRFRCF